MFVTEPRELNGPKYIINFPTKRHWRGKSRMEDIESGLTALVEIINDLNIRSIAIPPLGSGLGGLYWSEVRTRMEQVLEPFADVEVRVYKPGGTPSTDKMVKNSKIPKMTPGRAALVELIDRYLKGLLDPIVTLLEVHKLMYFMQEAQEPLRLNYVKSHYGPYAENLGHVSKIIEGHLVLGYADGGNDPAKQLKLMPDAVKDANEFLKGNTDTRLRFERVAKLVEGFESPYGLELLATVHWLATYEDAQSIEKIVEKAHNWNDRKRMFTRRQIKLAHDALSRNEWLN